VVAPDDEVVDLLDAHADLLGEHRHRAVLVQARHRGEAVRRDVGRVGLGDQRVGVRRVADDQDLDVVRRAGVQRLALRLEDRAVRLEQVGALHPLRARPRADEERDVRAVERLLGVVVDVDRLEQRERAVVELHRRPLGSLHGVGDLQQAELDLLVRAQDLPGRDAEQDGVADLAGRAGDGDPSSH
jgi:hypothetical protein